jgi:V8-like Glu-specific endopeptidase
MTSALKDQNEGSPKQTTHGDKATAEYWTEERRKAAKPIPLPKEKGGKAPAAVEPPTGEGSGTKHGHGSEAAPPKHGDTRALGHGVAAPLNYPYRTCGKIFFNQGGTGFSGSAALVAPNVLLTAGHCVFSNGVWSTNMTFFPSFPSRAATDPVRQVACGRLSCRTSWKNNQDRAHDYGMVWMPTGPGNTVGWLGLVWNLGTNGRTWDAVGYPATPNPPFNGGSMQEAVGSFASSSTSGTFGLTNDNMEHGSSGGPWITAWNEQVRSHANGLQSFHIHDGDTVEFGPIFTAEVKDLFDWISNPANH